MLTNLLYARRAFGVAMLGLAAALSAGAMHAQDKAAEPRLAAHATDEPLVVVNSGEKWATLPDMKVKIGHVPCVVVASVWVQSKGGTLVMGFGRDRIGNLTICDSGPLYTLGTYVPLTFVVTDVTQLDGGGNLHLNYRTNNFNGTVGRRSISVIPLKDSTHPSETASSK